MYDIILTLSTHKSNSAASRFLASLSNLKANILPILVAPEGEELRSLATLYPATPAVYIQSDINSLHFGRAWGFAWAIHQGLEAHYLCSCDNDLEWKPEAASILPRLNQMNSRFSMMGFSSTHPIFPQKYSEVEDDFLIGFDWLDGNCIFTRWQDNLQYGVMDAPQTPPIIFFAEIEYAYRMRLMTGKPIIFDNRSIAYDHLFRRDPVINAQRSDFSMPGIIAGNEFYRTKFGIENVDFQGRPGMPDVIRQRILNEANLPNFSKHLIFDGLWNDWEAIYTRFAPRTREIIVNVH